MLAGAVTALVISGFVILLTYEWVAKRTPRQLLLIILSLYAGLCLFAFIVDIPTSLRVFIAIGIPLIAFLIVTYPFSKPETPPTLTTPEPEKPTEPTVPRETRFSHTLILAPSGHGKTQLLSELISKDLFEPCSIIVFDSQGDLINNILKVAFNRERVVLIDPTDIEHPIALGLFDFNTTGESKLDQEKNLNSVIELLSFVLNSLLSSQLTSKQDVTLRYVIRLCLVIPDASIHTLRDIFSTGYLKYAGYVEKLAPSAQEFFKNEFQSRQFAETKEQILRRIYSILENQTLERIFSNSKSKLNMRKVLDDGSVVLVNSAKSLLKEEGSKFFSRFIVALIAQAIQERDPAKDNMPVYLYIDEASPVIDENITNILETARKYKLGLILAFQSLGQIPHDLQHSIITNTAIKMAGGISAKDARALADDMHTAPESLMRQPKFSFIHYVKDSFQRRYSVTPGSLDYLPKRVDRKLLVEENRAKYCVTEKSVPTHTKPDDDLESLNKS